MLEGYDRRLTEKTQLTRKGKGIPKKMTAALSFEVQIGVGMVMEKYSRQRK
jgi:hypothetical protein